MNRPSNVFPLHRVTTIERSYAAQGKRFSDNPYDTPAERDLCIICWQRRVAIACYVIAVATACYFAFQMGRGL